LTLGHYFLAFKFKLLGEWVYGKRIKRIYALLNGFEGAVERELEVVGTISDTQVKAVTDILLAVWQDKTD
jgi:hypothetical protein